MIHSVISTNVSSFIYKKIPSLFVIFALQTFTESSHVSHSQYLTKLYIIIIVIFPLKLFSLGSWNVLSTVHYLLPDFVTSFPVFLMPF